MDEKFDMRRQLGRIYDEQQHPGLRDMRALHRAHQAEETAAMRALGWLFVFVAGVGLGVCLAGWWLGLL